MKKWGFIAVHDAYFRVYKIVHSVRQQDAADGPDLICRIMKESNEYKFVMVSGCT